MDILRVFSVVCLLLAGCSSPNEAQHVFTGAAAGFHREHAPVFSPKDREILAATRLHIIQSNKQPAKASNDAFYRIRTNDIGFEVFVIYVTSYDGNRPVFTPCVHNEVFLTQDGSVLRVLTGPECWPTK